MKKRLLAKEKSIAAFTVILVSAFSLLLYLNATHGNFVYDDFKIIVDNSFIKEWKYFPGLFTNDYFAFSGELSYRPLVTITYFIDYAIWRLNPFGFHLTNILLHTGNTALFYLFLTAVLQNKKAILFSVLFFATHPLLIETVNAVGYREDLLSATFLLVSLRYFLKSDGAIQQKTLKRGDKQPKPTIVSSENNVDIFSKNYDGRNSNTEHRNSNFGLRASDFVSSDTLGLGARSRKNTVSHACREKNRFACSYGISLLAYLCALFSKEMAITFPAILLLFMLFSEENILAGLMRRVKTIYIGYLAISLFYLVVRFLVFNNPTMKAAYQPGGFLVNALTMLKVLASYVKLSFFPLNLNADYVVPLAKAPWETPCVLSIILLASIFTLMVILGRSRNTFVFWMGWFFIMVLPVMNILPIVNVMADRYLYFPVMGFCAAKGILIYRITDPSLSTRAMRLRKIVQITLVFFTIGGYGFSVVRKNGDWRDEFSLWTKTTKASPNSYRAHCNLGNVYMEKGLTESAEMEYLAALRINPQSADVHSNLGTIYSKQGLIDKAFMEYQEAVRLDRDFAQAHNNMGNIHFNHGRIREAKVAYEEALRIKPDYAHAHNGLGSVYDALGELDKAMDEFKKALSCNDRYVHAMNNLGVNYAKRGLPAESIAVFRKSIEIDPNQPQGYFNLGLVYEKLGKTNEAIREYQTVLKLDPGNVNAHYSLGVLYQGLGLVDMAIEEFQKIIARHPNNGNVYKHLVFLYLDNKKDPEMARYYLKELLSLDPPQAEKEDVKQAIDRLKQQQEYKK